MRSNEEYALCKGLAQYIKFQYPKVEYRFDLAGLNLSKAQAGMNKVIQCGRGWPDLFIAQPKVRVSVVDFDLEDAYNKGQEYLDKMLKDHPEKERSAHYCGLFIELKREGTVLIRPKDARAILKGETKLRLAGDWFDEHVEEQAVMLERLRNLGYKAEFCCGFLEAKSLIDNYLK